MNINMVRQPTHSSILWATAKEVKRSRKSMVKNSERATHYYIYQGPTFGTADIRIDFKNTLNQSVAHFGKDYHLPSNVIINNTQTILAGVTNFEPDEVEVFYLKRTAP